MTKIEVEQKYRVTDNLAIVSSLTALGGRHLHQESQLDQYFRHPCRDFRETDEALRIRSVGSQSVVTYKGPRMAGPVKTRPETEVPLVVGTLESWRLIWTSLGFTESLQVAKERQVYVLDWEQRSVVVALDDVRELGHFVELELVVDSHEDLTSIQESIQRLADALGLDHVEPRSYLGMLVVWHRQRETDRS